MSEDPVIIGGVPRSGVRLLAAILDGHPRFGSGPELPFVFTMARQWHDIHTTLGENHARHYGLSPESMRGHFRESVLEILMPRARQAGKSQFVLHSFAVALTLETLAALFDKSKFVLMVRDPRDVVRSLMQCDWRNPRDGTRLPYTQDAIAAARLWHDFTDFSIRASQSLQERGRLAYVRYEDLCERPRETLDRLGTFLGVDAIQPAISDASGLAVTEVLGNPHPALRAGAIDASSLGLGRQSLSPAQLAGVESLTVALRQRLGYG